MIPERCSPSSRSTSVMGMRASRPMGMAAILPSLTHRRTVSGCNPRRLATSPERSNLVFSVLITRIDYQIYVNLSTAVYPTHNGTLLLLLTIFSPDLQQYGIIVLR